MSKIKSITREISTRLKNGRFSYTTLSLQLIAFIIFFAVAAPVVNAAVFNIPSGNVNALIAAVNTANGNGEDDTINLAAGTYTLTDAMEIPLITSSIQIIGAGTESTIITRDDNSLGRINNSETGNLTLNGLTVNRSDLRNNGVANILNCVISEAGFNFSFGSSA